VCLTSSSSVPLSPHAVYSQYQQLPEELEKEQIDAITLNKEMVKKRFGRKGQTVFASDVDIVIINKKSLKEKVM
jgi:hypothetical protein